jgi:enterochelin esterase-like enzyme
MLNRALLVILALGAAASLSLAVAQAPAPRPADAPPLVPLTLERDGNFRIAPPYIDDPAFTEKANVPKGTVHRFVMKSSDSKIYPTAPGANGAPDAPFDRTVAVYLPPGYTRGRETPFIVVQDERWYVKEDAPDGRSDLAFMPVMLDNLIAEKRVPPMVAVMLWPGPGRQRSIEYDTVSDRYTRFVEEEVLPRIARDHGVNFTRDPEGRAVFGESSGAAAAMTMAWLHPELYRRVISYSGTFVALQRNETAPDGAWEYHQSFIPNAPRKPLRIWLHVSENDNGATTPAENKRNWVIANQRMADILKAKGYPYQFVFSEGVGHVSRPVQRQTMPEAFEWVWKGYQPRR